MVELPTPGPGLWRMKVKGHLANPNERFLRAVLFTPASPDEETEETLGQREYIVMAVQTHFEGDEIVAAQTESPTGITVTMPGKTPMEVGLEELLIIPPPPTSPTGAPGCTLQVLAFSPVNQVPGRIGWDIPRLTTQMV